MRNSSLPFVRVRPRRTRRLRAVPLATCVVAFAIGVAASVAPRPGFAHGPTIEISHQEMQPTLLNLFQGTTVHFKNAAEMPGGISDEHVIVDETGTIEGPPLREPGDGWHYTFETLGTFELSVEAHPEAKARIVVVPKRPSFGKKPKPPHPTHEGHEAH